MIMNMARRDDDDDYEAPKSFSAISPSRCTELMSTQSVGRVAWQGPDGLQILPVTYVYFDGSVVFRTSPNVAADLSSSPWSSSRSARSISATIAGRRGGQRARRGGRRATGGATAC